MQVSRSLVGQVVTEVEFADLTMDVVIRGRPEDVNDINKLEALDIEGPFGTVKLGAISTISLQEGPVSISRYDGERSATVSAGIVARDTQGVGRAVGAKIAALDIPPSVKVKTGGIFQQIAEGFQDVFTAMAVGIVLVYLVMVATLGSLRNPLVVVLCLPLAAVGALVALVVTGRTLSLSALMGTLLLIGVVVTNAIVLIVFVEQLRERGLSVYDALVEGSRVRMRPILMTAFTTTFALLPLATFPSNENGIIGEELATVVIGGLISSTFLTLVVVPVVYTIVHVNIPNLLGWIGSILQRALPSSLRAS
jgi:HAE1 family hydrophobic/amphiphilic exporter-1